MYYEAIFDKKVSAFIAAETLPAAISRAQRLGRKVFFTRKVLVKAVQATPQIELMAAQAHAILGEPMVAVAPPAAVHEASVSMEDVWQTFSKQLAEAGL